MNRRPSALACRVAVLLGVVGLGAECPRGTGSSDKPCSSDADCPSGQICHPIGQICVRSCTQEKDCPTSERACAPPGPVGEGDSGFPDICKCETDMICGPGYVCNLNVDDQCEPKCTADSDCKQFGTNRKCETLTGKCILQTCVDNPSICPAGTSCDPTSRQCV